MKVKAVCFSSVHIDHLICHIVAVLVTGGVLLGGCAPRARPVPKWAVHVDPPKVESTADVKELLPRLIDGLGSTDLRTDYVPAEQIAALAVKEIKRGHHWDAALLLSVATYRYHQQAVSVYPRAGASVDRLRARGIIIDRAVYDEHVFHEYKTFESLGYDQEIEFTGMLWQKDRRLIESLKKDYAAMLESNPDSRDQKLADLQAKEQDARSPVATDLEYQELADAFLKRLLEDVKWKHHAVAAIHSLSKMPIRGFQRSALQHAVFPFHAQLVREMRSRFDLYKEDLVKALSDERSETRSNAAVVMGQNPNGQYLPMLEQAYQNETDKFAKLSFAYALWMHDKPEFRGDLESSLNNCDGKHTCEHGVMLLQWGKPELVQSLSETLLVGIVGNNSGSIASRIFAAVILGEIGHQQNLKNNSIDVLLRTCADENEQLAMWAEAVFVNLPQVDRPSLAALLRKNENQHRAVLFKRLAQLAQANDLIRLRQEISNFPSLDDETRVAVLQGVGQIPGKEAEALLIDAYEEYEGLRHSVSLILANRRPVDRQRLGVIAAGENEPAAMVLAYALGEPFAASRVKRSMRSGKIDARMMAVMIAQVVLESDLLGDLWHLVDYSDAYAYPGDAYVRQAAMATILRIEIVRAFEKIDVIPTEEIESRTRFKDKT